MLGLLGLLGAENGPFNVGVIARVVAAMVYERLVRRLRKGDLEPESALIEGMDMGLVRQAGSGTRERIAATASGSGAVVWL